MTVAKLIKLLQAMPQKAKVAVDGSYSGTQDWKYNLVELTPTLEPQVEMHSDWRSMRGGNAPKCIDMCILGIVVGETLE